MASSYTPWRLEDHVRKEARGDWYIRFCCNLECTKTVGETPATFHEIAYKFDDTLFDRRHQFIQCAFPGTHVSDHNRAAPLFKREYAKDYKRLFDAKLGPWPLLMRFLWSVGLFYDERNGQTLVERRRPTRVMELGGHSGLRMTRVLSFLRNIGAGDVAESIYVQLWELSVCESIKVSEKTLEFWRHAAHDHSPARDSHGAAGGS